MNVNEEGKIEGRFNDLTSHGTMVLNPRRRVLNPFRQAGYAPAP